MKRDRLFDRENNPSKYFPKRKFDRNFYHNKNQKYNNQYSNSPQPIYTRLEGNKPYKQSSYSRSHQRSSYNHYGNRANSSNQRFSNSNQYHKLQIDTHNSTQVPVVPLHNNNNTEGRSSPLKDDEGTHKGTNPLEPNNRMNAETSLDSTPSQFLSGNDQSSVDTTGGQKQLLENKLEKDNSNPITHNKNSSKKENESKEDNQNEEAAQKSKTKKIKDNNDGDRDDEEEEEEEPNNDEIEEEEEDDEPKAKNSKSELLNQIDKIDNEIGDIEMEINNLKAKVQEQILSEKSAALEPKKEPLKSTTQGREETFENQKNNKDTLLLKKKEEMIVSGIEKNLMNKSFNSIPQRIYLQNRIKARKALSVIDVHTTKDKPQETIFKGAVSKNKFSHKNKL